MTTRRTASLFLFCFIALAVPAAAQGPTRRDPQAIALLQQSFLAMGGANLAVIRDTQATVQGTALRSGEREPFTATFKTLGAKNLRIDASTPEGAWALVVSETKSLSRRVGEEARRVSRASVANGGITHIPLLSVLADWGEEKASLEYVGLESTEAGTWHHIRLRRPPLFEDAAAEKTPACDLFVDAHSLLLVRLVYPIQSPSNVRVSEPVTMTYSDYRVVAGLAIPHTVTQTIRGQVVKEFQVTSFAVNVGVAASEFELR